MLIKWDDKYCVGVEEFDEQHKRLISLINELYDAMRVGKGKEVLSGIFDELIEYTNTHFKAEEKRFAECNYPGEFGHVVEHEKLTMEVMKFRQDCAIGREALSIHVMNFLKTWLTEHIMERDQKYAPFLTAKGVS